MTRRAHVQLFDDWAERYDQSVCSDDGFPHDGYDQVLEKIVHLAAAEPCWRVLDLGVGTGNLAERFVALGCTVWGVDFSSKMLEKARAKLPQARFVQVDLLGDWPGELDRRFDCIVSSYALHHFDLPTKLDLLQRLVRRYLAADGRIIVGDIAYPTVQIRERERQRGDWDEDEYYWAADETLAACRETGLGARYEQVSSCAGVFAIETGREMGNH